MTVDEDQINRMNEAYEQIFDVFDKNKLEPETAFGLMIKLTVQIAGDLPKEEMIAILSAAYDINRFLRPRSTEVH
jgi:hypothetical protein